MLFISLWAELKCYMVFNSYRCLVNGCSCALVWIVTFGVNHRTHWYWLFLHLGVWLFDIYKYLYCLHDLEIYIHMLQSRRTKMKQKENNEQKYMNKQLHSKTGIKDTNWKKRRRKKWYICACYKMKHIGKVWQQEHTKVMETARGKQK